MADYYVDHGAYASNLGTTPTWGVPQEGDGSSKDAATTSATASLTIPTGGSATGNTVSIAGITMTAAASRSAGSSNFVASTTLTTAADNLATAINDCTSAVSSSIAFGTPTLKNLVYARGPTIRGDSNPIVDIMMRIGSATLNKTSNSSLAIVSGGGWTITTFSDFTGGSGGCWGWLINNVLLGVANSIAIGAYGIGVAKPYVWTSALTTQDFVWCRTASGKTINMGSTSWQRGSNATIGGVPLNMIVDSNTKWTGDTGTGVITVYIQPGASSFSRFRPDYSNGNVDPVNIWCLNRGNLSIQFDLTNNGSSFQIETTGMFTSYNLEIAEKSGTTPGTGSAVSFSVSNKMVFQSLQFKLLNSRSILPTQLFPVGSNTAYFEVRDSDFQFNLNGSQTSIDTVPLFSGTAPSNTMILMENNRFTTNGIGTSGGAYLKWFSTVWTASNYQIILNRNTGVKLSSAALGIQTSPIRNRGSSMNSLLHSSAENGGSLRYENNSGIAEWDSSANYPTLSATQADGTPWSIRVDWFQSGVLTPSNPFRTPKMSKLNRLSTGTRTIEVEFLLDPTRTINSTQMGILITYTDSTGQVQTETTFLNSAPTTSTASWTIPVAWSSYSPYKLTLTTSNQVLTNTSIEATVVLYGYPSGSGNTQLVYDPEFTLT